MKKNKETLNGVVNLCPDAKVETDGKGPYYTKAELTTKDGKKKKCNNQEDAAEFITNNEIKEVKLTGGDDE